jgi:hypothetical protein
MRHCNVRFLQQILTREKKHLSQKDGHVTMKAPNLPELSAKRLMPILMCSPAFASYLPDWKVGKREPDRDFLWTLVHNVMPNYESKLVNEALRVRARLRQEKGNPEPKRVELPQDVLNELLSDPVLSGKF